MAHQVGWIDALRMWNAGNTSWCIPRKGTPAFEQVMKIRKGEKEAKSIKEIREELERKTAPSPKKEKRSVTISLESPSEKKKVESVKTEKSSTENNVAMEQQKMKLADVYFVEDRQGYTFWKLADDMFIKVGHISKDDIHRFYTGIVLKRKASADKKSYITKGKTQNQVVVIPVKELDKKFLDLAITGLKEKGFE